MGKHTLGPWGADASDLRTAINTKKKHIAMVNYYQPMITDEEHKANANLIAAAPDLLEALKNLLLRVETDADAKYWFIEEQQEARKAIVKAKGRE